MFRSVRKKFLGRKPLSLILARGFPGFFAGKIQNPIFVIGCARSGKTLLAHLLSLHLDVANWQEANNIWDPGGYPWRISNLETPPFVFDSVAFTNRWWRDTQPRQQEICAIFGAYQWLWRRPCFLNETAFNTFRIPYLLTLLPDARFIHIVRDGRAVVHSSTPKEYEKMQLWPEPYRTMGLDLSFDELAMQLAIFWKANIEEVAHQDQLGSLSQKGILLELSYEELCVDTCNVLDPVCQFIGLDSSRFLPEIKKKQLETRNYEWQDGLDTDLIAQIVRAMEPVLSYRGYR
jgi:hypothetical protein